MSEAWKSLLRADPIDWLLEEDNPSVRYHTLKDILDHSENHPDVIKSKEAISSSKVVRRIFHKQSRLENWESSMNFYTPKYRAAYWQVMILGILGLNRSDAGVRRACELVLRHQLKDGGFSAYAAGRAAEEYRELKRRGKVTSDLDSWKAEKTREHEYSCHTGNIISALLRLGYSDDARVEKALDWLVSIQNNDGGWPCPYWKAHVKDVHSCFHGTICALEAFSETDTTCSAVSKAFEQEQNSY